MLLVIGAYASRGAIAVGRVIADWLRAWRTRRELDAVSELADERIRVLPIDEPEAFVLGALRPAVYMSRGLLAMSDPRDLDAVAAHERAHELRRDPLARMVASLAFAFHLPGIAAALERELASAQEMAADVEAARAVGDAPQVAATLVRLARLRAHGPAFAMGLFGSDVEARVRNLLGPLGGRNRPRAGHIAGFVLTLLGIAVASGHFIHAGVESFLRLLVA